MQCLTTVLPLAGLLVALLLCAHTDAAHLGARGVPHEVALRRASWRRDDCAVQCQVECSMWQAFEPDYCLADCVRARSGPWAPRYEARFNCYRNMAYMENEFF